eukprot:GHVS01054400.1.p2 GENE.GHVS01054400.1~~GHVS01054400.1.p2  ORF type:complete len:192 (-),score=64.82 GHVS01054400.1:23-598(-)
MEPPQPPPPQPPPLQQPRLLSPLISSSPAEIHCPGVGSPPAAALPPIPVNSECLVCFDELISANSMLYKTSPSSSWFVSTFCAECVEELRRSQFARYVTSLAASTCAREQRALLHRGPPVRLSDKNGFPAANAEEVFALRHYEQEQDSSAILEGALQGEQRMAFWEEQRKFAVAKEEEQEEEDGESQEQTS